jgi:two-component system sensor histidine kinase DesK
MSWRRAGRTGTRYVLGRFSRGAPPAPAGTSYPAVGDPSRQATAIVAATLFLLFVARAAAAELVGGWHQTAFIAAIAVIPMLYAFPATRRFAQRHRWWLLAAQAVLTWVPVVLFGGSWVGGPGGVLAGLVLLSLSAPLSWLTAAGLLVAEVVARTVVTGLPYKEFGFPQAWAAAAWLVIAWVDDGLVFFGMVRLAQIVGEVREARGLSEQLAVAGERVEAAAQFQAAVGEQLAAVAAMAATAGHDLPGDPAGARSRIAEAGAAAREAAAKARSMTGAHRAAPPPQVPAPVGHAVISARLAWVVLVAVLTGFTSLSVVYAIVGHYPARSTAFLLGAAFLAAALQLYQSRPVPGGGRARWWQAALILQALLVFATFLPFVGVYGASMAGFLAGSVLLVVRGWPRWAGYAGVVTAWTVLYIAVSERGVTLSERLAPAAVAYVFAALACTGLLVYGLSWLAGLARQLEQLHGELARMAAVRERLRVARDVHDLLGLGLSAIALKADLIGRLIGRDDARAAAEIEEVSRISAAARAEMRHVIGDGQRLSLATEVAEARQLLGSAGVEVGADLPSGPLPQAADAVLAIVLREAVTNVLRHSAAAACTICVTAVDGSVRLQVSNDGVADAQPDGQPLADAVLRVARASEPGTDDRPGSGLGNLAARVAAAGGRLTSRQAGGRFDLVAHIPLRAGARQATDREATDRQAAGQQAGQRQAGA